jgi:phasin family protein
MFPIPEQFSNAAKAQLEAQLKILNALTSKAFEGAQQVIALNFNTGRAALDSGTASARQLLALKDPGELFAFGTSQAQPNIDSVLAYSRQLFGIASGVQAALLDSAKVRVDTPAAPAPAPVVAAAPRPAAVVEAAPAPLAKPVEAAKPVAALVELEAAPPAKAEATVLAKPQLKAAQAAPAAPVKPAEVVVKPALAAVASKTVVAAPAIKVAPPAVVAAAVAAPAAAAIKPAALAAAKNAGKGGSKNARKK